MPLNQPTSLGLLIAIFLSTAGQLIAAAAAPSTQGSELFEKRIRPLLADHCYECHSAREGKSDGGLVLDTRAGLAKGGVSGPALVAGEAERSLLISTLRAAERPSPAVPQHRLASAQLADLVSWVNRGAPDPRTAERETPNAKLETHRHWSFQPLTDPPVPETRNRRWVNNDIDRFILARIEAAGRSPALAADRRSLIRRVTFDLIGLPPTPREIDAFLRDSSADAFGKVVERLLASPHYGERWGRHWLDVARYADSSGDSSDYPIPQARLYRDYVIAAFNHDKPYDEFIREQVAGDLMSGETAVQKRERIIATGFVALSRRFASGGKETAHLTIEDTLDTMGRAVLGLSLSCARCHDHKHDPISMRDYYALYGIFASTRYPHPGAEGRSYQTNFVPLISMAEVETRLKPHREKIAALDAEIARLENHLDALAKEGLNTDDLKPAYEKVWKERDSLTAHPPVIEDAYAVADGEPANARLQKRGEPHNLGEEVPRGFLQILGGQKVPEDGSGSGRLELARWLTEPSNPLTARVMVNRIWQHHFGRGLVATPSDFGTHGRLPAQPGLLDFLASRFIESGWSVKAMHRLIVRSATYQQSSSGPVIGESVISETVNGGERRSPAAPTRTPGATVAVTDPPTTDSLVAPFPRQRLDAEQIRDALLAVSGQLDPSPGGPHPFPPSANWDFTQHKQFNAVYPSDQRSVYLMQQRIRKHPFLAIFDGADANSSTAERPVTTTPLQALFAMNDPFAHEQAEQFADRLLREAGDDRRRIDLAHQLAFGRKARRDEIADGLGYLGKFRERLHELKVPGEEQSLKAWSSYARALLGSNEFLSVD
jgi:mono/diheme cytochrome c family protein